MSSDDKETLIAFKLWDEFMKDPSIDGSWTRTKMYRKLVVNLKKAEKKGKPIANFKQKKWAPGTKAKKKLFAYIFDDGSVLAPMHGPLSKREYKLARQANPAYLKRKKKK